LFAIVYKKPHPNFGCISTLHTALSSFQAFHCVLYLLNAVSEPHYIFISLHLQGTLHGAVTTLFFLWARYMHSAIQ